MDEILESLKTRLTARKLRTLDEEGWFGGVCAGVGYWLGVPVWIVRILWTTCFFIFGFGLVAYILLWVFLPEWEAVPTDYEAVTGD